MARKFKSDEILSMCTEVEGVLHSHSIKRRLIARGLATRNLTRLTVVPDRNRHGKAISLVFKSVVACLPKGSLEVT